MVGRLVALILLAGPAWAAPHPYVLDQDRSRVVFTWHRGTDAVQGSMPVKSADLVLDFDAVANSRVAVVLDLVQAEAGFPFATQAMIGPKVLDARRHPEITFVSTGVRADGDGALVDGQLTIRGVTRPATFAAELYRQRGTEAGDLSRLTVLLSGSVQRSDFGADGWSDMAGDPVTFQVLARISRAD